MKEHLGLACSAAALSMALACSAPGGEPPLEPVSDATTPPEAPISPDWCADLPRAQYASLERVELDSKWFEVYALGEGVFALYEPHQWQEVISYLIVGSDRALLFDSGLGIAAIRPVVEQLTALPVVVLNSHTHYDHIGGNHEFDVVWAQATDFTRARAAGLGAGSLRAELADEALCGPLPPGVSAETFSSQAFTVQEWVGDGARIELGDLTLEVIAIPGHSPDSLAVLDRARGFLWVGDSFYEGPVWLFDSGTDLEAYARSVERLAALVDDPAAGPGGLVQVFAAHNTPRVVPGRLVELSEALAAVRRGDVDGTPRADGSDVSAYDFGAFSLLLKPSDVDRLPASP